MFGSLQREFENDPFFSQSFSRHQEHMNQVMRSFSDPFGRDPFLSITDGRNGARGERRRHDSQVALRGDHRNDRDPFDMVNSIMSDMRSKMFDVHRNFDQIGTGSDAHSFKSSSIKTYSKVGDTAPKVFEATSQTCKVPGGIKETRQAVRDSESGVAKMAVGHHIQDRSHVIEKRMNTKTGNEEVHQEFCNLDESEAPTFDEEWCRKISKFKTPGRKSYLDAPKHKGCHRAEMGPKDGGSGKQKSHPKPTVEGSRRPKVSYGSPQY